MKTISFAITACNEAVELERLLDQLNKYIRPEDEIVLQLDTTATDEVKKVAEKYSVGSKYKYLRIYATLNNDFASFKNNLNEHCTRDYILYLDADEYVSDQLIEHLPFILDNNDIDLYWVPRINTVSGLTEEDIQRWGWIINERGWVNYPDAQGRIVKRQKGIKWEGRVHERIIGYNNSAVLPYGYDLIHPKDIDRQRKQNNFYNTL